MSKENSSTNLSTFNDGENKCLGLKETWNYHEGPVSSQHNKPCCSPANGVERMPNGEDILNPIHNIEAHTDKSVLSLLKQEKRSDISYRKNKILNFSSSVNPKPSNELDNVKLKKTGLSYIHEKVSERFASNMNTPRAFDEYAETDSDQPMNYAQCYDETNQEEEKRRGSPYLNKTDFLCIEESVEEEKHGAIKSKGAVNKEPSRNKKEMFGNTSRSFKEIFNFFKDRDKKRTSENSKVPTPTESPRSVKTSESYERKIEKPPLYLKTTELSEQKNEKLSQSVRPVMEQCDKEPKLKSEAQTAQQTPLMFSRCSSLGSLSGFEQVSIPDDRSSVVSDFSRRTSGVVSPSELPDSPAQIAQSSTRSQSKSQIGFFGKKKVQTQQDNKSKVIQNATTSSENSLIQIDNNYKKSLIKHSVFEDYVTSFKDESTPTKLHSIAASSLSSLTIDDDDDDYELLNRIILDKEKQNFSDDRTNSSDRQEPVGEPNLDSVIKSIETETVPKEQEENFNDEENDEITDLTPCEEQILDQYIRRGIANWTRRNVYDIKPFSWDIGLTCRAARAMINNRMLIHADKDIRNEILRKLDYYNDKMLNGNCSRFQKNNHSEIEVGDRPENNYSNINDEAIKANSEPISDQFKDSSYYITYEEHLLDQCIRKGMAKITNRNMNDIQPFSWDVNQICLTTRMMLYGAY